MRITGGPDHPAVTDGPFAEGAEVACGYYVFEADNLDDALELARQIRRPNTAPSRSGRWCTGAPPRSVGNDWLALLLEPAEGVITPGTPEWEDGIAQHGEFGKAAGDHILGGAPLHPPTTATTVRVRDGEDDIDRRAVRRGRRGGERVLLPIGPLTVTRRSRSHR